MQERADDAPMRALEAGDAWPSGSAWVRPEPDSVDLWRIDLARPQGEDRWLVDEERRRADRFLVDGPRRQFARSRAGLRRILGLALDLEPRRVRFSVGAHGRPALAAPDASTGEDAFPGAGGDPPIDFNLSHSGDVALVAVHFPREPARLGVDVEQARTSRPLDRLAARFFAPEEADQYRASSPEERVDAFYRGWTRKEAYLKAWGTGLTFSSRRFALDLAPAAEPDGGDLLRSTEMPEDDGIGWRFQDLDPAPGYRGALCIRPWPSAIRRFVLEPEVANGAALERGLERRSNE